jgi:dTDP-4-dehydrorhamnose 3,5-epimerase
VLSDIVDFTYKCTDFYHHDDEGGVIWNDPEIGITWPFKAPALSAKDQAYSVLSAIPEKKLPAHSV